MAVKTTTTLGFTLLGCVILAIVCGVFAMASPYWVQRRQMSGNTVTNAGIWEICFLQHSIPKQYQANKEYTGCFMFYGKRFADEKSYFTPWWLIGVQISMSLGFLGTVLAGISLLIYFLCTQRSDYWIILGFTSIILFLSGGLTLGAAITFGLQSVHYEGQVHSWVRWPHFMYFSWGFGFACLTALFSWVGFIVAAVESMHKARNVTRWIASSQMSMAMSGVSKQSLVSGNGRSAAPSTISASGAGAPPSYDDSQASHGGVGVGVTSSVSNALNKSSTGKSSVGASQPSLAPSSGGGGGGRIAGIRSSMGKGRKQRRY